MDGTEYLTYQAIREVRFQLYGVFKRCDRLWNVPSIVVAGPHIGVSDSKVWSQFDGCLVRNHGVFQSVRFLQYASQITVAVGEKRAQAYRLSVVSDGCVCLPLVLEYPCYVVPSDCKVRSDAYGLEIAPLCSLQVT